MEKPFPSKHLVLYADDDTDDHEFVREAFQLKAKEIELKTFCRASDLLNFIHSREKDAPLPCLIILDINIPGLDGREALGLIRKIPAYEDVPVVLFTTSAAPHDVRFAAHHRAGFFTKPLNGRQMEAMIEKFLDHCNEGIGKDG